MQSHGESLRVTVHELEIKAADIKRQMEEQEGGSAAELLARQEVVFTVLFECAFSTIQLRRFCSVRTPVSFASVCTQSVCAFGIVFPAFLRVFVCLKICVFVCTYVCLCVCGR